MDHGKVVVRKDRETGDIRHVEVGPRSRVGDVVVNSVGRKPDVCVTATSAHGKVVVAAVEGLAGVLVELGEVAGEHGPVRVARKRASCSAVVVPVLKLPDLQNLCQWELKSIKECRLEELLTSKVSDMSSEKTHSSPAAMRNRPCGGGQK
jgi:hypothetical protein